MMYLAGGWDDVPGMKECRLGRGGHVVDLRVCSVYGAAGEEPEGPVKPPVPDGAQGGRRGRRQATVRHVPTRRH